MPTRLHSVWLLSNRGHVAHEAEKIYYLALYGKQFASSGLGEIGAGCASHFVQTRGSLAVRTESGQDSWTLLDCCLFVHAVPWPPDPFLSLSLATQVQASVLLRVLVCVSWGHYCAKSLPT